MQTKKTYEFVAEVLRQEHSIALYYEKASLILTVEAFADAFQRDNPRFNRERFLKACGLDV